MQDHKSCSSTNPIALRGFVIPVVRISAGLQILLEQWRKLMLDGDQ